MVLCDCTHANAETKNDYLRHYGVKGSAMFHDGTALIGSLKDFAKIGPLILGTHKLGGLPGGHIILVVDYNAKTNCLVCHDPFGNAMTNYKDHDGAYVEYPVEWLTPSIELGDGLCRIMRWVA